MNGRMSGSRSHRADMPTSWSRLTKPTTNHGRPMGKASRSRKATVPLSNENVPRDSRSDPQGGPGDVGGDQVSGPVCPGANPAAEDEIY